MPSSCISFISSFTRRRVVVFLILLLLCFQSIFVILYYNNHLMSIYRSTSPDIVPAVRNHNESVRKENLVIRITEEEDKAKAKAEEEARIKAEAEAIAAEEARISNVESSLQNFPPMNVIILYPDDWRHDDLADTNPHMITPFFTRLAKEGIRFTQNAVTTSICWISRATLFTGQYVSKHESTYLFRPKFVQMKERWENTWPYLLQHAGYFVGHVGKWQYHNNGNYKGSIFNFSSYFEGFMWHDKHTHITDMAQNEAIRFLSERPKDKPFALTVAIYPPKGITDQNDVKPTYMNKFINMDIPQLYDPEESFKLLPSFLQNDSTEARKRYKYRFLSPNNYTYTMRAYNAMIAQIDDACDKIVEEIKRQGIYNETMIIVSADNGEFHSAHGLADKWYPYQESIRVPLIIYDPRMPLSRKGTLDDSMTLNIDLAETILGAAGIDPPNTMQGRDISDLYLSHPKSTKPWRTEFYYEFPKLNGNGDDMPASTALVRKEWKFIDWTDRNYTQLFNLIEDPLEMNDLAQEPKHANLIDEMKVRLDELRYEVMSPNVPGTKCDPLWPAGSDYKSFPDCSPSRPNLCCPPSSS